MNRQIILASISPRRRQVMQMLGVKFKAVESNYEEINDPKMKPKDLVKFLALGKANAVAKKYKNAIIITADTMVVFKGKAIGKPENAKEAFKMLKNFSGKKHEVVTGVVVMDTKTKQIICEVITNINHIKKLTDKEILDYVKRANPYDKAGGYNPQSEGLNIMHHLKGDYTTYLGLPLVFVYNSLIKLGLKI